MFRNSRSLLAEYCKKVSVFVMWELFEVIWRNEKRNKFQQHRCQNSNKEYERGERNDVMAGVKKNLNFVNEVTKIPASQMKCPKEKSARKEKSNCGSQVAKNEGGKICGNQVAKIVGEERENFNRNFGNEVAKNGEKRKEKKKKCDKLAMDLPKIGGVNCLCLILILQRLK